MIDDATRRTLYDEAFALLARADALLDAMREKYEHQMAENATQRHVI